MWKTIGIYVSLVAFGAFFTSNSMQAAEQTGGMVTFHGEGTYQEFPPDFGLWTGVFYGGGTTDSESGPLHRSGWMCTGEQAFQGGTTKWAGGFCTVTDVDGDTVNLRWQSTKSYAGATIDTRGDYYSGTGKYAGITGSYTLHCDNIAVSHFFCAITGGEYNIP